ncbi:MAG: hypothetical protein JWO80_4314 [Bryobacterales bacterium]|nr:hypothetical protein [Bryobacterales bacterium]
MMVHLREPEILKRQMPYAIQSGIYVYRAVAHLLKELPELIFIHSARISERQNAPDCYAVQLRLPAIQLQHILR